MTPIDYIEILVLRCLAQAPELQEQGVYPSVLADALDGIEQERRSRGLSAEREKQLDEWTRAICPDPEAFLAKYLDGKP